MKIPLFRPVVSEEAIAAAGDVLRSGWIGPGPRTEEFEHELEAFLGAPYCVAVNSGTSALHLALRLLDLNPGDEVITTAFTFVATNQAILYEHAVPVFADIEAATGNIAPSSIEGSMTDRTRAIVLVHYAGQPCDLDEIYALARVNDLTVIEDCAHAFGATYKGGRLGSTGDIQAFSFDALKNLTAGDGGAIAIRDGHWAERLRRLRLLGIHRDPIVTRLSQSWRYDVSEVGFRYHMNDITAAIALAQLSTIEDQNRRRGEIVSHYRRRLADIPGVRLLEEKPDRESAHHLFPVLVEGREDLILKLEEAGVTSGIHYIRNDLFSLFEEVELANTQIFSESQLSLPLHTRLSDEEVNYVCDVIKSGW